MNSDQIKCAADHLEYSFKLKMQEVRDFRSRADKLRREADEHEKRAAFLESEASALIAAANEIERIR